MAKTITKVKVMKEDGTFTDYIPIGAEAKNVKTIDGESVQNKLNNTVYINDIVDNLTTNNSEKPLSAKQGKELNEKIGMHDISHKSANDLIGSLYFGYGTYLEDMPSTSGYFINLTNTITEDTIYLYNKQIFIDRVTNNVFTRQMNNGTWSNWILLSNPMSQLNYSSYTLEETGYNLMPIGSINNYDSESLIKNNDNTFSFNDISNKILYLTARIKGSAGNKFIKLEKNGTVVLNQSTHNSDTETYQLTLIAPLIIEAVTDKFAIFVNGNANDIIENIRCIIK